MILPVAVVLVALSVPLTGGDMGRLGELRLRGLWWVMASIGLQIVVTVGVVAHEVGAPLHLVSYALAAVFVSLNRRLPGMLVIGAGGAMNLAPIAANGGVMPASPWALEVSGLVPAADRFVNSGAVESARLWWLGDVFAIPEGWPLANVFSIGDIVLLVGVGILLHTVSRRPAPVDRAGGTGTTVDGTPLADPVSDPGAAAAGAPQRR